MLTGITLSINRSTYPKLSDNLIFQGIDGSKQTLKELKSKHLLVTFRSPDCIICMHKVEQFSQLFQQFMGGEKLELLANSMYFDRPSPVIKSSTDKRMLYPIYFDLQKTASIALGNIIATPTSFLLNASGDIIYKHAGRVDFLKS